MLPSAGVKVRSPPIDPTDRLPAATFTFGQATQPIFTLCVLPQSFNRRFAACCWPAVHPGMQADAIVAEAQLKSAQLSSCEYSNVSHTKCFAIGLQIQHSRV